MTSSKTGPLVLLFSPVLLLAACVSADSPTGPPVRAAASMVNADVQIINEQEWVSFSFAQFVPCAAGGAGEVVEFSGRVHLLFHVNTGPNTQPFDYVRQIIKEHGQPQGLKGVGLTTGTIYNAVGVTQQTQRDLGASNNVITYVNVFFLIAPGAGNNFYLQELYHLTEDAHGLPRVEIDGFAVLCGLDGGTD